MLLRLTQLGCNGNTSEVTEHAVSLEVEENSINSRVWIGEPFAAFETAVGGGTSLGGTRTRFGRIITGSSHRIHHLLGLIARDRE